MLCAIVIFSSFLTATGHNSTHETVAVNETRDLYRELFTELFCKRMFRQVPPNKDNPAEPVDIRMRMTLDKLLHLDMSAQTLDIIVWFEIIWHDKSFEWNISVYPYTRIVVERDFVWKPVIAIANSLMPRDEIMSSELPLEVDDKGIVHWWPGDTLSLECFVDIRYYPYDVQECSVRIVQWVGSKNEVNCTFASFFLSQLGNAAWDIVGNSSSIVTDSEQKHGAVYSDVSYAFWEVDFRIILRRKSTFYTMNVIFPVVLVSGLNSVVFLLPVECGEKMSVSLTTLLTLAFYMALIQEEIPNNSDEICYLAVYLLVQMIFGALAVVLTALQVEYHHLELLKGNRQPDIDMWTRPEGSLKFDYSSHALLTPPLESQEDFEGLQEDMTRRTSKDLKKGRERTVFEGCAHIVAELDVYCFPIFFLLNLVSFLTYYILIKLGPASDYPPLQHAHGK